MDYNNQLLTNIPEESRSLLFRQPIYYDNDGRVWREWLPESGEWSTSSSESNLRERYFSGPYRRDGVSSDLAKSLGKSDMAALPHLSQMPPEPGYFSLTLWRQHSFAIDPLNPRRSRLTRESDHLYDGWISANLNTHWGDMPMLKDPEIEHRIFPWLQRLLLSTSGPGNLFLIIGGAEGGSTSARWLLRAIQELRPWHQNEEVSLTSLENEERKRGQRILFIDDSPGGNITRMVERGLNSEKNLIAAYTRDELRKLGGVPDGAMVLDLENSRVILGKRDISPC